MLWLPPNPLDHSWAPEPPENLARKNPETAPPPKSPAEATRREARLRMHRRQASRRTRHCYRKETFGPEVAPVGSGELHEKALRPVSRRAESRPAEGNLRAEVPVRSHVPVRNRCRQQTGAPSQLVPKCFAQTGEPSAPESLATYDIIATGAGERATPEVHRVLERSVPG